VARFYLDECDRLAHAAADDATADHDPIADGGAWDRMSYRR
jgi:hypothetical protein